MPNEENINYPYEDDEDKYIDIICPHCSFYMVVGKDDEYIRCTNCHTIHHKSDVKVLTEDEVMGNNMFNDLMKDFDE